MIIRTGTVAIALTLASICNVAFASGLETLLMPGRVIEGHAEIEKDCNACHDTRSEQATAQLCTSCHEDIGIDRKGSKGFHGRFALRLSISPDGQMKLAVTS